jgi:hypothetical protein
MRGAILGRRGLLGGEKINLRHEMRKRVIIGRHREIGDYSSLMPSAYISVIPSRHRPGDSSVELLRRDALPGVVPNNFEFDNGPPQISGGADEHGAQPAPLVVAIDEML